MMKSQRSGGKTDRIILLFFLTALLGYMPTARAGDRLVWIAALFLLLVRTGWLVLRRRTVFRADINLGFYLLLVGYGAISCLWADQPAIFLQYSWLHFPVVMLSVLCLCAYPGQRMETDGLIRLLVPAGLLAGFRYCCYTDWSGFASGHYLRGSFGGLLDDVTSYNNYTMLLSIVCVIALYFAIVQNEKRYYPAAAILMVMLLIGGSRKNVIAVPVTAFFFALSAGCAAGKLKKMLVVALGVAAGIYALMNLPGLHQLRESLPGMAGGLFGTGDLPADASTQERLYLMEEGVRIWSDHLLAGIGWDQFRLHNALGVTAHNNYVEMLVSLGLIGFFLFYLIFARLLIIVTYRLFHQTLSHEDLLMSGFALSYLLFEIGSVDLYNRERMILLLAVCYWHSLVSKRTIYRLVWKR